MLALYIVHFLFIVLQVFCRLFLVHWIGWFFAGFAGFLPVVAGGVWAKWLIISGFWGLLLVIAIAGLLPVAVFFV
jgi:hypothetical protein